MIAVRGHGRTLVTLCAAVTSYTVGQSLLAPVLPTLQTALHTSGSAVAWVLTAYLLSASVCTPIFGRFADAYGAKRMFVLALAVLTLGAVLGGLADSLPLMIVARVVQGGGGGVLPISFGIAREEFAPERRNTDVGIIAALSAVGAGLGILVAGPIVEHLGYHWLFWIQAAVTGLAAVAAQAFVPGRPARGGSEINWLIVAVLSTWLIALLLAVNQSAAWGWTSGRVLGLLVLGGAGAAAWVALEVRSSAPLIDMRMMRLRPVWTNNAVGFGLGVLMFVSFVYVPVFAQTPASAGYGFGASITAAGLMVLPQTASVFMTGTVAGRLTRRFGAKQLLVTAPLFCVAGALLLAFAHHARWQVGLATGINGIGIGTAFAVSSGLLVAAVPVEQAGAALGMNANIRNVGGAVGTAVMSSVIVLGRPAGARPLESGFTHGFLILAAVSALCVLAAACVPSADGVEVGPEASGPLPLPFGEPVPEIVELDRGQPSSDEPSPGPARTG